MGGGVDVRSQEQDAAGIRVELIDVWQLFVLAFPTWQSDIASHTPC